MQELTQGIKLLEKSPFKGAIRSCEWANTMMWPKIRQHDNCSYRVVSWVIDGNWNGIGYNNVLTYELTKRCPRETYVIHLWLMHGRWDWIFWNENLDSTSSTCLCMKILLVVKSRQWYMLWSSLRICKVGTMT